MFCKSQRKYIYLFSIFFVTLAPAILVLAITKMPTSGFILTEENAKFEASVNADFLIFWAVLFFTCTVGMIELLHLVKKENNKWMNVLYFVLYWGFLVGIILCLSRSWVIMRENYEIMNSGAFGNRHTQYLLDNLSIFDTEWVRSRFFEAFVMFVAIVVFDLVFWGKIWLASKPKTRDDS